jgi:hypothetical protein
MNTESEETIILEGDNRTCGMIVVQNRSSATCIGRAILFSGMIFIVMLLSVFVPILHFVLVPLFFVIGVVVFIANLRAAKSIARGEGSCPYCSVPFRIFPRPYRLPFSDVCEGCRRSVTIVAAAAPAAPVSTAPTPLR